MTDPKHSSIKAAEKHVRNAAQNILDALATIKEITKEDQPVKTIETPAPQYRIDKHGIKELIEPRSAKPTDKTISPEIPVRRSRHNKKHGNTPHERDQYRFEKRKKREAYRRERNIKADY